MDTPAPLEGTTWVLTAAAPLGVELGEVTVTAEFDDGRLAGTGGCNRYTTGYTIDGRRLDIGPAIAATLVLCDPARNAVERAFLERLPRTSAHRVDGTTLTLLDRDDRPVLVFEALDVATAILGPWTVVSYYRGDAVTTVVGEVELTAAFDGTSVTGSTGAGRFVGTTELDGRTVVIGGLVVTSDGAPPRDLVEQQDHFLEALRLARSIRVTGDRAQLLRDGGTIAVTLARPAPPG